MLKLSGFPESGDIKESGKTLFENSLLKSREALEELFFLA